MRLLLADENFPYSSFSLIAAAKIDIRHIGFDFPSISDSSVIKVAREQERILLTLDADHGELIFRRRVPAPPGIVFFRVRRYRPPELGEILLDYISNNIEFLGYFTVITARGFRQRSL